MGGLKNLGLKQAFFLLSALGLLLAALLLLLVFAVCIKLQGASNGYSITVNEGAVQVQPPSLAEGRAAANDWLGLVQLAACLLLPACGLGLASLLFYRLKLRQPIALLQSSMQRIRQQDLDFTIPKLSDDELGQLCEAFETMRAELLRTNQELWRQAEERKRLNAAFSHDLRNPLTVLKGSLKLLRQNSAEPPDSATLARLEAYTLRIEQYVEAMSSVQRLEQLPLRKQLCCSESLKAELTETASLLAPGLQIQLTVADFADVQLDLGLFLTVAENLISNAARFAQAELRLDLQRQGDWLCLTVFDDGPGFPPELLRDGPQPFGKMQEPAVSSAHFGMGLYISQLLCVKNGGGLRLANRQPQGAEAVAKFQIDFFNS